MEALIKQGRQVLVVGDFNISCDPLDVHPNIKLDNVYTQEEIDEFSRCWFRSDADGTLKMVDVWRRCHPQERAYTVWDEKTSARAFDQGQRIDYFIATRGALSDAVLRCEILKSDVVPPKWSDHAAMVLELDDTALFPQSSVGRHAVKEWVDLKGRFVDARQRTIAAMFQKHRASVKRKEEKYDDDDDDVEEKNKKKTKLL